MSILTHVDATPAERTAYLKQASALRRAQSGEESEEPVEIETEEQDDLSDIPADESAVSRTAQDDVVVVDGDFDDLLKQAFLKPEVARKTGGRKKKAAVRKDRIGPPGP